MRAAATRLAALAPLALLLSGCAVAAIPVLAGGLVGKKAIDDARDGEGAAKKGQASTAKTPRVEVLASAAPAPAEAAGRVPEPQATVAPVGLAPAPPAAELPAVSAPPEPPQVTIALAQPSEPAASPADAGSFDAFVRFAGVRAAPPLGGKPRQSALIDPATLASMPKTGHCAAKKPAVAIDIDPGAGVFNLDDPPLPAPGLADALARLRLSGLSVLWVSGLPGSAEDRLRTILQATGLDPDKDDSLLLLRRDRDRKATRLRDSARDWCIVAVAGDRRGDFEESYDYLRDPDGPIARTLDMNLGNGWFITPLPIQ